jgi:hypothetical protein
MVNDVVQFAVDRFRSISKRQLPARRLTDHSGPSIHLESHTLTLFYFRTSGSIPQPRAAPHQLFGPKSTAGHFRSFIKI